MRDRSALVVKGGHHNRADVASALDVHPRRHRLPDRLPTQPRRVGQHAPLVALPKPRVRTIPGRVEGSLIITAAIIAALLAFADPFSEFGATIGPGLATVRSIRAIGARPA